MEKDFWEIWSNTSFGLYLDRKYKNTRVSSNDGMASQWFLSWKVSTKHFPNTKHYWNKKNQRREIAVTLENANFIKTYDQIAPFS